MSSTEKGEISCHKCVDTCCRDIILPLSSTEVDFMKQSGTVLVDRSLRPSKKRPNFYEMVGACGNLVEKDGWLQCNVFEDPARPKICGSFQVGSPTCVTIFERGATRVEITKKPLPQ